MRGVVSLAAAFALPAPFPARDIIVFLAFCAIFATLVVQGTSLGWVIRRLGLEKDEDIPATTVPIQVRVEMAAVSLDAVQQHAGSAGTRDAPAAEEAVEEYQARAERLKMAGHDDDGSPSDLETQRRMRLVEIDAARRKLVDQADEMDSSAHRALGEEFDLEEAQIRRALGEV
ncbi:NhaP-type Na+/H+ or K+/H+ antiporter [Novosphingobium chloroacetimidivorans]|uniref:NhaP-type Na+/H+ or K+/H+ antiporter n=2 Tax=Novosphingobium chloroacetimidivorans TaxID=1428314 RepID=A0A7W7NYY8_9SPHN|nr:NhaP-type Na+/H+ or K+/H+ antiporter [Novosphingobium chloroacetimidivorans]